MNYKLSELAAVIHFFYTGNVTIMASEESNLRKILSRDLSCRFKHISTVRIKHSTGADSGTQMTHPQTHRRMGSLDEYFNNDKEQGITGRGAVRMSLLYCNDSMNNMNPQLHQFKNHWIRYKKLRQDEFFNLSDVKIYHPQFLH
jgi:hypothetical protein